MAYVLENASLTSQRSCCRAQSVWIRSYFSNEKIHAKLWVVFVKGRVKTSVRDFLNLLSKLYKLILFLIFGAAVMGYPSPEVTICQRSRAVHLASANRR